MILNDLVMAAGSGYYYCYLPVAAADAFPFHPLMCYQRLHYCHYSYFKVAIMLAEVIIGSAIIAAVTDFATSAELLIVAGSSSADST